jgi:hypothetical protein
VEEAWEGEKGGERRPTKEREVGWLKKSNMWVRVTRAGSIMLRALQL